MLRPVTTRSRSRRTSAPPGGTPLSDLALVPALAGARLVPPDASLDRPVSALVLLDADAPEEPGALLVCPGSPPEPLPAGCAGVVCRTAPVEALDVPVLVLAPGAAWGAVIADLSAVLLGGGGLARGVAARSALRAPLIEGRGFMGLAAAARELLGAPVAILDEYLDLRGSDGLGEDQQAFLAAAVQRARGHGPASVIGPFMEEEMTDVSRAMVADATGAIGVLMAWVPPPLSPPGEAVMAELAEACALERAREEVRTETESRLRGDLVEELMAGEVVSRESLVRRARHLGADLSRGAVALIGKLQDPHTEGRVISDPRLVRRFMQQARAAMDLHWPRALVDWNDGRLLALLPPPSSTPEDAPRDEIESAAFTLGRRLLAATRETVPGLVLTLALSRYTPEPERLGAALDESRLALSIGERLGRQGEVVTFEETGTYKLLFQIFADRPEELTSFYDQTLAPLVRYDEQYQTELVGTLFDLPGQRLQPGGHGEHPLHPPPHGAVPARPHRRAVGARHREDRRPREAVPRPQGDAAPGPPGGHGGRAPPPGHRPPLTRPGAGSERSPQDAVQVVGQRPRPPVPHRRAVHLHHGQGPGDRVGEHDLARAAPVVLGGGLLAHRHRLQDQGACDPPHEARRRRREHLAVHGAEGVAERRLPQAAGGVQHQGVAGAGGGRPPLGAARAGVGEALVLRPGVAGATTRRAPRSRARPVASRTGAPRAPPPRAGWGAGWP